MKHMRTYFVAGTLAAAMLCGALIGCAQAADTGDAEFRLVANDETCVVIAADKSDTDRSLYDALAFFATSGEITMDGSESEYGFYLTSLNGVAATNENYWAVYTTLGTYEGVSYSDATWGTIEHSDALGNTYTLASASYGVSGLPLVEGELYALVWTAIES